MNCFSRWKKWKNADLREKDEIPEMCLLFAAVLIGNFFICF